MQQQVIKQLHTYGFIISLYILLTNLNRALKPAYQDVVLNWNTRGTDQVIKQAPIKLPPIFNKQLYTVYALCDSDVDFSGVTLEVLLLFIAIVFLLIIIRPKAAQERRHIEFPTVGH